MYVYTLEDFGSSGFTEITAITIHRIFFQASRNSRTLKIMVDHGVTKISLPPPPPPPPLFIPMIFGGCVFHILLPRYCDGCPMSSNFGWDELSWRRPIPKGLFTRRGGCLCARVTLACKRVKGNSGLLANYPITRVNFISFSYVFHHARHSL